MTGRVITFYSYKGGVGRTQALANVAVELANRGKRVVVVDMDLESPGAHSFFHHKESPTLPLTDAALSNVTGVVEHIEHLATWPSRPKDPTFIPCTHPRLMGAGTVDLLPAGRLDQEYTRRLTSLSWQLFYEESEGGRYIEALRDLLISRADYVLVDSRTGMTDVANVCTFQLPDVVVVLFALHHQGLEGAERMARAIQMCQKELGEGARPRKVLLVPSRVDEQGESDERDRWLLRARDRLAGLGELLIGEGERIPYVAKVAYGERVVVHPEFANNLASAYQSLADRIEGVEPHRRPSISPLPRSSFDALSAEIDALRPSFDAFVKEVSQKNVGLDLSKLPSWAFEISDVRQDLAAKASAVLAKLRAIGAEEEIHGELLPPSAVMPGTVAEYAAIHGKLRAMANAIFQEWAERRRERLKRDLLDHASGDEEAARAAMVGANEVLRRGDLDAFDLFKSAALERVTVLSIGGLLARNALTRERLEQSREDALSRRAWLDEQLEAALTAPSSDGAEMLNRIENLLRLRVEEPEGIDSLHAIAYETACKETRADVERSVRLFDVVGVALWREDWARVFAERPDLELGQAARDQLRRRMTAPPPVLNHVIDGLRDRLVESWRIQEHQPLLRRVFTNRAGNVLLAEAVNRLSVSPVEAGVRRGVLASWILSAEPTSGVVGGYVRALLEDGYDAEALYVSHVFGERGVEIRYELRALASTAYVLRVVEEGAAEKMREHLVELLSDKQVLDHLYQSTAGSRLLALLAAGALKVEVELSYEAKDLARAKQPLSEAMRDWVRRFDRPSREEMTKAARAVEIRADCERLAAQRFHSNWPPGADYTRAFQTLAGEKIDEVFRAKRRLRDEIERLDADLWVRRTYDGLRANRASTPFPEGDARNNMVERFDLLKSRLRELDDLHPEGQSLNSLLDDHALLEKLKRETEEHLLADSEDPIESALRARARSLMKGET